MVHFGTIWKVWTNLGYSKSRTLILTYAVGPLVLACWLLTLKLFLLALLITFFCLQSIRVFFSKLGPFNIKSISIPTPFYQWILLHLTSLTCGNKDKCPETIHKVFAIHVRKQKKLYVKHQCSKKYWIFTFRAMNFSDIMAEAVLSIEKSCLVAHAFEHIL